MKKYINIVHQLAVSDLPSAEKARLYCQAAERLGAQRFPSLPSQPERKIHIKRMRKIINT